MFRHVITAAGALALLTGAASAQVVYQGVPVLGSVQAGPICDKVNVPGGPAVAPFLYGFSTGRSDMMQIIKGHEETGTPLNYQVGGSLACNSGDKLVPQIIWVN